MTKSLPKNFNQKRYKNGRKAGFPVPSPFFLLTATLIFCTIFLQATGINLLEPIVDWLRFEKGETDSQ